MMLNQKKTPNKRKILLKGEVSMIQFIVWSVIIFAVVFVGSAVIAGIVEGIKK